MTRAADSAWFRDKPKRSWRLPSVPPRVVAGVAMAAALLAAWHHLRQPQLFPVRSVVYQGRFGEVDQQRLEAAVASAVHGNFFTLDLARVGTLAGQVPWVDQVSVTRRWPPAIVIAFTVQKPLAHWAAGGWVNADGAIVHLGGRMLPKGLPELSGPPGSEPELFAALTRFSRLLAPYGLAVRAISRSARGGWRLVAGNGMTVVMGRSGIDARLQRFLSMLPAVKKDGATVARVDLRYNNGFAVTWAPQPSTITRESR